MLNGLVTSRLNAGIPGHDLLVSVQASLGEPELQLGKAGVCRFCGCSDPSRFRNTSHAVPESLGNKWLVSRDECDSCNTIFAPYDDALAKSVGAVLTVGGTRGKRNRVRQTGRSAGPAFIRHEQTDSGRHISMQVSGSPFGEHVMFKPHTGELRFRVPVIESFVPRLAYKALAKMALAIMPDSELPNFAGLLAWLRTENDNECQPDMTVGLSFGSVGNAPPIVSAKLWRRRADGTGSAPLLFILTIGSVCFQILLRPDCQSWSPPLSDFSDVRPAIAIIGPEYGAQRSIEYGMPNYLDWSAAELGPSPVEAIVTDVHPLSGRGNMFAVLRKP